MVYGSLICIKQKEEIMQMMLVIKWAVLNISVYVLSRNHFYDFNGCETAENAT